MKLSLFSRHFLKVIALLSSVLLWFYVLNSESVTEVRTFNVHFVIPDDKALSKEVDREIKVKLSGARIFLKSLKKESKRRVYLELNDKNQQSQSLTPELFTLPFGVKIEEIKPAQIDVLLSKKTQKKLTVKPFLVGKLPASLSMQNLKVRPKKVSVSGPHEKMKNELSVPTRPIDLAELVGEGQIEVDLNTGPLMQLEENQNVTISYRVKPKSANYTLKNVKIRFISAHQNFLPSQREVALDVYIPPERENDKIGRSDVEVLADLPDKKSGESSVSLRAKLPEHVHLLQIHPERINVRWNKFDDE